MYLDCQRFHWKIGSCKQVGCKYNFQLGLQPVGCLAYCYITSYRNAAGFIDVIWISITVLGRTKSHGWFLEIF